MSEMIDLGPLDALVVGAVGEPGRRTFLIQARARGNWLTVLVEKQQVAMLAAESIAFLDQVAEEFPEPAVEAVDIANIDTELYEPMVPLFRAQLIGLGFDTDRELVLLELRERPEADDEDHDEPEHDEDWVDGDDTGVGYVARVYATRAQVRKMASHGTEVVLAGRLPCPLCDQPMDPAGHICPRWN